MNALVTSVLDEAAATWSHPNPNYPGRVASVHSEVNYATNTGRKPVVYEAPPGQESKRTNAYDPVNVEITDGRVFADDLSLDVHGFELLRHQSETSNFYNDEEVVRVYYPEMEGLLQRVTGASKALVFDHNTRSSDINNDGKTRAPVRVVHNDYTLKSGPQRVTDLLSMCEAGALLKHRFAIVNIWRPIRGPVLTTPLALIDARSLRSKDLIATDLKYAHRTGEIYEVSRNPKHNWVYFPRMENNEVLLIKGYDSENDGKARFTPHTAFDDPTTPSNAPARESIEIRALVFFVNDDPPSREYYAGVR